MKVELILIVQQSDGIERLFARHPDFGADTLKAGKECRHPFGLFRVLFQHAAGKSGQRAMEELPLERFLI